MEIGRLLLPRFRLLHNLIPSLEPLLSQEAKVGASLGCLIPELDGIYSRID